MLTLLFDRLARQLRYLRLAWRLAPLGVDFRSGFRLWLLGAMALIKDRTSLKNRVISVNVDLGGRSFPVFLKNRVDLEVLREIGLEDEYALADSIEATFILDLGAHIGLASLRMLASHPGARVVAIEADPALIPRLRANTRGLPITVVHGAVASSPGKVSFFRSDQDSWTNSLWRTQPDQASIPVPALTIAELLDAYAEGEGALLKLDIEGGEWEALSRGIPGAINAVIGELHAAGNLDPMDLLNHIEESFEVRTVRADSRQIVFMASKRRADLDTEQLPRFE